MSGRDKREIESPTGASKSSLSSYGSPSTGAHRAYERIVPDYSVRTKEMEAALDALLASSKGVESRLLREIKPTIAIALKWKFDYLAKCLASPFELECDVKYWHGIVEMLRNLGKRGWFEIEEHKAGSFDAWKRTAHGFDIGWTTTTKDEQFAISRQIAEERTDQIISMLSGLEWFAGKHILDSGCGPGRYVDILRRFSPARVVALDQGERLIESLKVRFKDDPVVETVRGTCERLEFGDGSFDFVLSNGVLHHTPSDIHTMIRDHARVLKPGGVLFILLVGKGGLELKLWEFLRGFLYDVPIENILEKLVHVISPLRLQGIVDHMYGEYQQTDREEFEGWSRKLFGEIRRVPGIAGLDVTPELYADDPYFAPRFGTGQLRYLCFK